MRVVMHGLRAGAAALALFGLVVGVAVPAAAQSDVTCHIEWTPMRDGVRLATEVYLPATPGRYPVILQRTPYNRTSGVGSDCNSALMQTFARSGYAALNQDVRGRYRSEGTMDAMRQEANDGYDAIEWAAAQSWSTGKVGTYGGSYVGLTQWQPAIKTPPSLAAMAPHITASDYHDHWTYVNGAFDLWFAQSWMLLTFAPEQFQRNLEAKGLSPEEVLQETAEWVEAGRRDILSKWVWTLPYERFSEFRTLAPYYYTWIKHRTYDGYWAKMDIEPRYGRVTVPSLNTGGWYDIFQIGTVRNYQGVTSEGGSLDARNGSMLVMRSLCHACPGNTFAGAIDFGPNNSLDQTALTIRFFDRWLKGIDNGIEDEPSVRLFVMVPPSTGTVGGGFWVTADEYPLPGTERVRFNLRSGGRANTRNGDGALSVTQPSAGPADRFVYDPRNPVPTVGGNMCCINDIVASGAFDQSTVELRDDVLVYTSAALEEDLVVIGSPSVTFWAASSAPDTDFTAKLVDVHLDGFAHNVLDRVVRARYRNGSKSAPRLIRPGKAYEYTIELGNTATVFKKGHRIRLEISSSNFPHYDRNPNTGLPAGLTKLLRPAKQTVYHDATRRSYLELPVAPVSVP